MTTFTVDLDDARTAELRAAAAERKTTVEYLLAAAAEHFLAEQTFTSSFSVEDEYAVREGMAQLERGEGIPHEQVVAELRAKFRG